MTLARWYSYDFYCLAIILVSIHFIRLEKVSRDCRHKESNDFAESNGSAGDKQ